MKADDRLHLQMDSDGDLWLTRTEDDGRAVFVRLLGHVLNDGTLCHMPESLYPEHSRLADLYLAQHCPQIGGAA